MISSMTLSNRVPSKLLNITSNLYKSKLQMDNNKNGKSIAWVVCRIGLGKVVYLPAFSKILENRLVL
jgi:hypothetical protein